MLLSIREHQQSDAFFAIAFGSASTWRLAPRRSAARPEFPAAALGLRDADPRPELEKQTICAEYNESLMSDTDRRPIRNQQQIALERALRPRGAKARSDVAEAPADRSDAKIQAAVSTIIDLPSPPQSKPTFSRSTLLSFALCVLLPLIAASIYYFAIASDQYVVEFQYTVREGKSGSPSSMPSLQGAASLMGMASSAVDDYTVTNFVTSRQAILDIQKKFDLRSMFSRDEVDYFSRLPADAPIEKFSTYWQRMVSASYDQITGIGTAQVRAFSPEDALKIANTLLSLSEELINKISNRPQLDAIRFAEADVARAEERLKQARLAMTQFRNTEQVIDPQSSVVTSNANLSQTIRATIAQMETELATLRKGRVAASGTLVSSLEARIKAAREQLAVVESQVKETQHGNNPLAQVVGRYEELTLEQQFSQSMLQSAMTSLEQARAYALAQHIYVSPFVYPSLPQSSTYPRRTLSVIVVGLFAMLLWMTGTMIVRSIQEQLN